MKLAGARLAFALAFALGCGSLAAIAACVSSTNETGYPGGARESEPGTTPASSDDAAAPPTETSTTDGGATDGQASADGSKAPVDAGGKPPIFRMNCGGGASYPLCGFSTANPGGINGLGVYWDRKWVPGAGPQGQGVVEIEHRPQPTNVEHYLGWALVNPPAAPQGSTRYLRYKIKLLSPIAWQGVGGQQIRFGGKFIILGDNGDEGTRIISNIRSSPTAGFSQVMLRTERNIQGAPSRMDTDTLAPDVWHSIQIKVRSSSTTSSGDGHLYTYVDGANASEATPTVQSSGDDQINTNGWTGVLGFGYYFDSLGMGGHAAYQVIDFEYDDHFVSSW
jgi:hypothetical protein